MLALGLMSGTSMDGIDAALIETDGEFVNRHTTNKISLPYSTAFKKTLLKAIRAIKSGMQPNLNTLSVQSTLWHVKAVKKIYKKHSLAKPIDIIGYHGQTMLHNPNKKFISI